MEAGQGGWAQHRQPLPHQVVLRPRDLGRGRLLRQGRGGVLQQQGRGQRVPSQRSSRAGAQKTRQLVIIYFTE